MRKTRRVRQRTAPSKGMTVLGTPVEVRHHPAARRLTLRVSRTRRAVIVTLPMQCDEGEAGPFITRNIDWVRARLECLPQPVDFIDGAFMPLRGKPHKIVFTGKSGRDGVVIQTKDPDYPELRVSGDPAHAPRRLKDWLASEARRDLGISVSLHAKNIGVAAKRIAIRDQSSRWGSCSTTGVLSFSWRLVMAPPPILDYVAAHEVAHLKEMNHGPRFWALVRKTYPELADAKRWLQIYGMDLHRYGTAAG
jgi:predicted metal-dependent hydrolase